MLLTCSIFSPRQHSHQEVSAWLSDLGRWQILDLASKEYREPDEEDTMMPPEPWLPPPEVEDKQAAGEGGRRALTAEEGKVVGDLLGFLVNATVSRQEAYMYACDFNGLRGRSQNPHHAGRREKCARHNRRRVLPKLWAGKRTTDADADGDAEWETEEEEEICGEEAGAGGAPGGTSGVKLRRFPVGIAVECWGVRPEVWMRGVIVQQNYVQDGEIFAYQARLRPEDRGSAGQGGGGGGGGHGGSGGFEGILVTVPMDSILSVRLDRGLFRSRRRTGCIMRQSRRGVRVTSQYSTRREVSSNTVSK